MKNLPATALRSNGADYLRTYHHVAVDPTITMDDIMRPSFWAHHAQNLKAGDLIDVVSDTLDVQLRVIEKGIGFVRMRPRLAWVSKEATAAKEDAPMPDVPAGYSVKRGPGGRWRVFTDDPLMEIASGLVTEREAIKVAVDHASKAVAA